MRKNETIEEVKEIPKDDGYGELPTIGDIKGLNDWGEFW